MAFYLKPIVNRWKINKADIQVSDYSNMIIDDGIAIFDPVQDLACLDLREL